MFFRRRKPETAVETTGPTLTLPPLTAEEFIRRFARDYVNYAALIEVAFGHGDEMFEEYDRLSDADLAVVVQYAKNWAQKA